MNQHSPITSGIHIILASKSPRRLQLIATMGFSVTTVNIDVDEAIDPSTPLDQIAERLACRKAEGHDRSQLQEGEVLVTADTIVVSGGRMMGKPHSREEAIAMLTTLSGHCHAVYTGVCLTTANVSKSFTEASQVYFRHLSQDDIEYYVDTYKPYDKAGAYGIQEWIGMVGIERIEGCYYNVMGLPTARLYSEIMQTVACRHSC